MWLRKVERRGLDTTPRISPRSWTMPLWRITRPGRFGSCRRSSTSSFRPGRGKACRPRGTSSVDSKLNSAGSWRWETRIKSTRAESRSRKTSIISILWGNRSTRDRTRTWRTPTPRSRRKRKWEATETTTATSWSRMWTATSISTFQTECLYSIISLNKLPTATPSWWVTVPPVVCEEASTDHALDKGAI